MDFGRIIGILLAVVAMFMAARPKPPLPSAYYMDKLYQDKSNVIDVTVLLAQGLPVWESAVGLTDEAIRLMTSIENGNQFRSTEITMNVHTGTHVDAPRHFVPHDLTGIDEIDVFELQVQGSGVTRVIQVPDDVAVLDSEFLKSLSLSEEDRRVIFKTRNTSQRLLDKPQFAEDFVGLDADGAEYMVHNTSVKVVAFDYLSICVYKEVQPCHISLLEQKLIPVEGLNLTAVDPGLYYMNCMPLKIKSSDGALARVFLVKI